MRRIPLALAAATTFSCALTAPGVAVAASAASAQAHAATTTGSAHKLPDGWRRCNNTHHRFSIGYPPHWHTTQLLPRPGRSGARPVRRAAAGAPHRRRTGRRGVRRLGLDRSPGRDRSPARRAAHPGRAGPCHSSLTTTPHVEDEAMRPTNERTCLPGVDLLIVQAPLGGARVPDQGRVRSGCVRSYWRWLTWSISRERAQGRVLPLPTGRLAGRRRDETFGAFLRPQLHPARTRGLRRDGLRRIRPRHDPARRPRTPGHPGRNAHLRRDRPGRRTGRNAHRRTVQRLLQST